MMVTTFDISAPTAAAVPVRAPAAATCSLARHHGFDARPLLHAAEPVAQVRSRLEERLTFGRGYEVGDHGQDVQVREREVGATEELRAAEEPLELFDEERRRRLRCFHLLHVRLAA